MKKTIISIIAIIICTIDLSSCATEIKIKAVCQFDDGTASDTIHFTSQKLWFPEYREEVRPNAVIKYWRED